jgi:hypothetical protein
VSAIIIDLTSPDRALVATDTLAVYGDGSLAGFTSKAFVIPHLNMIVAGTGIAGVASAWLRCVNEELCPLGIEWLNTEAPEHLNRLFEAELGRWGSGAHLHSMSIYHVGFSEVDGSLKGFQLNSESGFRAEQLEPAISRKPPSGPYADHEDAYVRLINIMIQQRMTQESKPPTERLYIGGDIQLIELNAQSAITARIFTFD